MKSLYEIYKEICKTENIDHCKLSKADITEKFCKHADKNVTIDQVLKMVKYLFLSTEVLEINQKITDEIIKKVTDSRNKEDYTETELKEIYKTEILKEYEKRFIELKKLKEELQQSRIKENNHE